jgi:ribosomal protein S21
MKGINQMALNFNFDEPAAEAPFEDGAETMGVPAAEVAADQAKAEDTSKEADSTPDERYKMKHEETPPANRDPNLSETKTEKGAVYAPITIAPENAVKIPGDGLNMERARKALEWVEPKLAEMREQVEALAVTDEASNAFASELLTQISTLKKSLETARKALIEAPDKYVRSVNHFVKTYRDPVDAAIRRVKEKLSKYVIAEEAKRRKAEAKAREAEIRRMAALDAQRAADGADGKKQEQKPLPVFNLTAEEKPGPVRTESGTVSKSIRKTWKITDESKLPREYLIANMTKIKTAWNAGIDIPGVETIEEAIISARTR